MIPADPAQRGADRPLVTDDGRQWVSDYSGDCLAWEPGRPYRTTQAIGSRRGIGLLRRMRRPQHDFLRPASSGFAAGCSFREVSDYSGDWGVKVSDYSGDQRLDISDNSGDPRAGGIGLLRRLMGKSIGLLRRCIVRTIGLLRRLGGKTIGLLRRLMGKSIGLLRRLDGLDAVQHVILPRP